MYHVLLFAQIFIAALVATPSLGAGTLGGIERDAPRHLYLVKDCVSAGWDPGDIDFKCFESIANLNYELWGYPPTPTAATPVIVDIGPGDFTGIIICPDGEGHVTFRGAGRDRTVIHGVLHGISKSAVSATSCNALGFEDIRLEAESPTSPIPYGVAVSWIGGGSSSWTDVDLQGTDYGWYDINCPIEEEGDLDQPLGVHYWWGSKVVGGKVAGYYAECGETWFYGGEIAGLASVARTFEANLCAVRVAHRGQFHMFGSAARVSTAGASIGSGTVRGVLVGMPGGTAGGTLGNGEFHSHGGVISVNSSGTNGVAATGLQVEKYSGGNARAHTLETGFALEVHDTEATTRLSGTGIFESPHLWEARIKPPEGGGSITGQDIYVETDCNSLALGGSCIGGLEPHLMIYKSGCPWFDTQTGACRVGE